MSAPADLTRDEAIALLSMSGGIPTGQERWYARHHTTDVHRLAQSARAKLTAYVAELGDDAAEQDAARAADAHLIPRCFCTGENLERSGHCEHPDCPNRPARSTAVVRIIPLCHCTGEQLERGGHCDHPDCPNRPA